MPQVKQLSLNNYEKYFFEALKPGASNNVIYYHLGKYELEISFSWDNFINIIRVPYNEILSKFPPMEAQKDIEVNANVNLMGHPSVVKFIEHYTHGRGIPED